MNFFNDDPFDDLVREFFSESPARSRRRRQFIRGEEEERTIDFIENDNNVFLIFEVPGFNEKDLSITIKGRELEVSLKKEDVNEVEEYLKSKLQEGIVITKKLPTIINTKGFTHSLRNGVLELRFNKNKEEP